MSEEVQTPKKQAELIDLAERLDRYGAKLLSPEARELSQRAARILATPGAAMTLTLRVDQHEVCIELIASGARGGRVVVAAHSTSRTASAEM